MTKSEEYKKLQKKNTTINLTDEQLYQNCLHSVYEDIIKTIDWRVEHYLSKRTGVMEGCVSVNPNSAYIQSIPANIETDFLIYYESYRHLFFRPFFNVKVEPVFVKKPGFLTGTEEKTKITISFSETGLRVATDLKHLLANEGIEASFGYSISGYCYESFDMGGGKIEIGETAEYIHNEKRSECGSIGASMTLYFRIS